MWRIQRKEKKRERRSLFLLSRTRLPTELENTPAAKESKTAATNNVYSICGDRRGVFISADECSYLRLKREAAKEETVL